MAKRTTVISGVVLDESVDFSLGELCQYCGVGVEVLIDMVDEGLLEPIGSGPDNWRFPGSALQRAQTALRLTHDLRVNLAGAALALELLDELDSLRRQLRLLQDRTDMGGAPLR